MLELDKYQHQGLIWYGNRNDKLEGRIPCGYPELDKVLSGGWPKQGLFEFKTPVGIGEIRLVLPYLQHKQSLGLLVFIGSPTLLNAEFLLANDIDLNRVLVLPIYEPEQALWAAEQCLKSGCCSTVMLWLNQLSVKQARRLLLASEQGESTVCLYRAVQTASQFSIPSTLSMSLKASDLGLSLKVDKQRGGQASDDLVINMWQKWPDLSTKPVCHRNVLPFPKSANH